MSDMYSTGSRNRSALKALVDNCVWSEVGDVVKIVVSRKDLDTLFDLEDALMKGAFVRGWMSGHKGENLIEATNGE